MCALSEDGYIRDEAAKALGKIKDPHAVEPLQRAVKDSHIEVQMNARRALMQIMPKIDLYFIFFIY
ncbi:HEAT repeat domain-containing protein [Methanobacterium sp.]|uniref:HEAT repeat domain-containing protein n=1 Tax=Methanobacterium sp. TaxID=2164 RepID=UPI003D660745